MLCSPIQGQTADLLASANKSIFVVALPSLSKSSSVPADALIEISQPNRILSSGFSEMSARSPCDDKAAGLPPLILPFKIPDSSYLLQHKALRCSTDLSRHHVLVVQRFAVPLGQHKKPSGQPHWDPNLLACVGRSRGEAYDCFRRLSERSLFGTCPISNELKRVLDSAAQAASVDTIHITLGGQDALGEGFRLTGWMRHDRERAARHSRMAKDPFFDRAGRPR